MPFESPDTASEYDTALVPLPSALPPVVGARVPNVSLQLPGFVVE